MKMSNKVFMLLAVITCAISLSACESEAEKQARVANEQMKPLPAYEGPDQMKKLSDMHEKAKMLK